MHVQEFKMLKSVIVPTCFSDYTVGPFRSELEKSKTQLIVNMIFIIKKKAFEEKN